MGFAALPHVPDFRCAHIGHSVKMVCAVGLVPRHTLHRLTRDLAELVGPEVSAASPQGRFPAEKVDGQRLTGVDAFTCTSDAREVAALRPVTGLDCRR